MRVEKAFWDKWEVGWCCCCNLTPLGVELRVLRRGVALRSRMVNGFSFELSEDYDFPAIRICIASGQDSNSGQNLPKKQKVIG